MKGSKNKIVSIEIGDKVLLDISQFEDFQGELKDLSHENYEKAKKSILDLGFSFAPHVWANKGKYYLIDGHQRLRTVRAMHDEGYEIPKLPAIQVKAKTREEAKKKVLAAAAQYGQVTYEGLHEFIETSKLDYKDIATITHYPEIDMDRFEKTFYIDAAPPEEKEVSFTATEKEESDEKVCPKCGFSLE